MHGFVQDSWPRQTVWNTHLQNWTICYTARHFRQLHTEAYSVRTFPRKNGKASTSCESAGVIWVSTYVGCNTSINVSTPQACSVGYVISAYWCPHTVTSSIYQTGAQKICRTMVTNFIQMAWYDSCIIYQMLQPRALQQQRRQATKDSDAGSVVLAVVASQNCCYKYPADLLGWWMICDMSLFFIFWLFWMKWFYSRTVISRDVENVGENSELDANSVVNIHFVNSGGQSYS